MLTYGFEALIPSEIVEPTCRVIRYEEKQNLQARNYDLDMVEELRSTGKIQMENYKRRIMRHYNSSVRERTFQIDNLVLRRFDVQKMVGKLDPEWEGPYKIKVIHQECTYKLMTLEGVEIPRTWNVSNLKKFYY
ncbi:UNVERIFIED_CONTAM: hypothetical protein Slati_0817600 [Sesamum latifolium]|uniref:Reverse transcriptase n=1 Tax=Sesamum latifolium TaxID=2727402 RepID=A0AAW2XNN4_9LAMI